MEKNKKLNVTKEELKENLREEIVIDNNVEGANAKPKPEDLNWNVVCGQCISESVD